MASSIPLDGSWLVLPTGPEDWLLEVTGSVRCALNGEVYGPRRTASPGRPSRLHDLLQWDPHPPTLIAEREGVCRFRGSGRGRVRLNLDLLLEQLLALPSEVRASLSGGWSLQRVAASPSPWPGVLAATALLGAGWVVRRRRMFAGLRPVERDALGRILEGERHLAWGGDPSRRTVRRLARELARAAPRMAAEIRRQRGWGCPQEAEEAADRLLRADALLARARREAMTGAAGRSARESAEAVSGLELRLRCELDALREVESWRGGASPPSGRPFPDRSVPPVPGGSEGAG